jgi:hypothetical protein
MFGGAFILGGIYLASVYNKHQNRKKNKLKQSES